MIRVSNLYKSFAKQDVLKGVDLEVQKGEIFVVLGGSGEGKSVILKNCVGLVKPDNGEITIDGTMLKTDKDFTEARKKMGMVFQNSALFDSMTVKDNILLGVRENNKNKDSMQEEVMVIKNLQRVNLTSDVMHKFPNELSGGMRKRVGIARSLILKPKILFYDEPTTGLDPVTSETISKLIVSMRDELQITSVVVTHDMASAFFIADKIAMLLNGKIICVETPDKFRKIKDPYIQSFIAGVS